MNFEKKHNPRSNLGYLEESAKNLLSEGVRWNLGCLDKVRSRKNDRK